MNLCSKSVVKKFLKKHKIRPLKRLGQNFLIDKRVIKKIIQASNLCSEHTILEIGPGIGAITRELAKNTKKVIAMEKDPKMVEILKETLEDFKNVEIVQGDVLKIEPKTYHLKPKTYKIIANLPFYITAPCIRKFLEKDNPPQEMILIVQKEVAQRICARTGKMNLLAVSVQFYAKPKIISFISKKSFWPSPKVDGAILKIPTPSTPSISGVDFFRIVKAGFSQPRKQLANNLSKGLKINKQKVQELLLKINIQPSQRAETLSISQWIKLTEMLK